MLYIIDSNVVGSSKQLKRILRTLDSYNAEYTLISTYKFSGMWAEYYRDTLDKDIVRGILKFYDYDLSKIAKSPGSSTVRTMAKRYPQAVRDYKSVTFQDKKLSEIVDWFSEHPYFFNVGILYDSTHGTCIANLRDDEFRTFLPKSKKNSIRRAALCLAFDHLGISEDATSNFDPKRNTSIRRKGESKWE